MAVGISADEWYQSMPLPEALASVKLCSYIESGESVLEVAPVIVILGIGRRVGNLCYLVSIPTENTEHGERKKRGTTARTSTPLTRPSD